MVVAFDGTIADTLTLRAESIVTAVHALTRNAGAVNGGMPLLRREQILPELAGRTLHECILHVVPLMAPHIAHALDETALDIMGLHAQRSFSARVAQGIDLARKARVIVDWAQAHGVRLVLRADSHRRDVEAVLRQWDWESVFTFVRSADDLPRTIKSSSRFVSGDVDVHSSLGSSYAAIVARLDALGVPTHRGALEFATMPQNTAHKFFGTVVPPISFDVL